MIPFDLTFGFVAGLLLAFSAKTSLKNESNLFSNKYIYIAVLWMAIFYGPSTMWFQYEWPFWNTMYFLPPNDLPGYLIWLEATFLIIAILIGFLLAHYLIRSDKDYLVLVISIVVVVILILFLLILYDRSFFVGTYNEWLVGTTVVLWESPLFTAALIAGFVDTTILIYLLYRFNTHNF
ncbi:MAG: hypothetical protein ACW967_10525 [Candidatus Hodarchaeales archaeon]|jgi:predicted MFS family arabinose efflux permease